MICILEVDNNNVVRSWILAAGFSDAYYRAKHRKMDPELIKLLKAFASSEPRFKNGKSVLPTGHVMIIDV